MKVNLKIFCFVVGFVGLSVYGQKFSKIPGDTTVIEGRALNGDLKDILLNLNYRKYAKLEIDIDSLPYHFGIISVEPVGFSDTKFKVRVVHAPIRNKDKSYMSVQDPFVVIYQLRVIRKNGKLYLKDFKYLMGEL